MTHISAISMTLPLPSPSLAAVGNKQQVHVSYCVSLANFLLLQKLELLGLTHESNQSHDLKKPSLILLSMAVHSIM